jgi:hypothetical protein
VVAANKAAAASRSLVSSSSSLVSSSRDRSPDRAANKAASRNNAPVRRKEPPVSAGGFILLDPSPIGRGHGSPRQQPFMAWRGGHRPFDKGHPRSLPPFDVVIIASPKRLFLCTHLAAGAICRGGRI